MLTTYKNLSTAPVQRQNTFAYNYNCECHLLGLKNRSYLLRINDCCLPHDGKSVNLMRRTFEFRENETAASVDFGGGNASQLATKGHCSIQEEQCSTYGKSWSYITRRL